MAKSATKTRSSGKNNNLAALPDSKPVIERIAPQTVRVGGELVMPIQAKSANKTTFELLGPTRGAEVDELSGEFRWTPRLRDVGRKAFKIRVTDSVEGSTAEMTYYLTVMHSPPTIEPIDDQETPVSQPFEYQVEAEDPDGGMLSYELPNAPPDLSIDNDGLITGTPQNPGTFSVEVEVTDEQGESAMESFDLTVTNDPPTIEPIEDQDTPVGMPFSLQVNAGDPEGESLAFDFANSVPNLTIDSSGQINGTPQSIGTFPIIVRVTDPHGATTTESFDLTVTNDPPQFDPIDDQSATVNQPFSLQVSATDPEGQGLNFDFANSVPNLTISSSGLIMGTPQNVGTFPVQVRATDPHGAASIESFDLTVTNDPPQICPIDDQSTPVAIPYSWQVGATDPEGESLIFDFVSPVPNLTIDSNGLISGTPQSIGTFSVHVRVTDPQGASAIESFDLTVTNDPPEVEPLDDQSTPVGQPFSLQVYATDPEGEMLCYSFANPVPNLTINASGEISGSPQSVGTFPVEVRVTDPHGATTTETFDLTVTNDPPVIDPIGDQSAVVNQMFSLQVMANDPDGHSISYDFANAVPNLTISSSGQITGTPQNAGTFLVQVRVTDSYGATVIESFDLTVTEE